MTIHIDGTEPNEIEINGTRVVGVSVDGELAYVYPSYPTDIGDYDASGNTYSVSSEDGQATGLEFNNDGTKFFVSGDGNTSIFEYDVTTPYDITTASYSGSSLDVSNQLTSPAGIAFNDSGTEMNVAGSSSGDLYRWELDSAFDLSSNTTFTAVQDIGVEDNSPEDIAFNNDGSKLYMAGSETDAFYQYSTSNYNIVYDSVDGSHSLFSSQPRGFAFTGDGSSICFVDPVDEAIKQIDLPTNFDITDDPGVPEGILYSLSNNDLQSFTFNNYRNKFICMEQTDSIAYEFEDTS